MPCETEHTEPYKGCGNSTKSFESTIWFMIFMYFVCYGFSWNNNPRKYWKVHLYGLWNNPFLPVPVILFVVGHLDMASQFPHTKERARTGQARLFLLFKRLEVSETTGSCHSLWGRVGYHQHLAQDLKTPLDSKRHSFKGLKVPILTKTPKCCTCS